MNNTQKENLKMLLAALDVARDNFSHCKVSVAIEALNVAVREAAHREGVKREYSIISAWGKTFIVPMRYRFIAVDKSLHVYAFTARPEWVENHCWLDCGGAGDFEMVGSLSAPLMDYHNALKEIH